MNPPMTKMSPPRVPDVPVPIVSDNDLPAYFLKACDGKSFEQRRDSAIIRTFIDTGCRLGEVAAGLILEDVDLDRGHVVYVVGKGSRGRAAPFGKNAGQAIDRYLRIRSDACRCLPPRHCGFRAKGRMTDSGIVQMIRRRCRDAGIGFRSIRTGFGIRPPTSGWPRVAMKEMPMRIFGWKSREMLARYSAGRGRRRTSA